MLHLTLARRRLQVVLISLIMLTGIVTVAAAPQADAQQRNLVVFGDS